MRSPAADAADEPLEGDLLPILSGVATPPASLRDRILASARPQTFAFVMRNEGPWLPRPDAPVAIKELLADSRDRLSTRLVRFRSPDLLPAPALAGRRAFYVVQGSLTHEESGESLPVGAFRDEFPPQAWRADDGTLVVEYCEHLAGAAAAETHHRESATWIDALPGGRVRLIEGGDDGPRSFLVLSMSPGSTLPSHPHSGVEELYVLSGSCTLDGRTLTAATITARPRGRRIPTRRRSTKGAMSSSWCAIPIASPAAGGDGATERRDGARGGVAGRRCAMASPRPPAATARRRRQQDSRSAPFRSR